MGLWSGGKTESSSNSLPFPLGKEFVKAFSPLFFCGGNFILPSVPPRRSVGSAGLCSG